MQKDQLELLASMLDRYIKDNQITQAECARRIGVNDIYVHSAVNRKWEITSGKDRKSPFSPIALRKIKVFLGFKDKVWDITNYMIVTNILAEAKMYKEHRIVSGEKGTGKTFAAEQFRKMAPNDTFLITASDDMNHKGFITELAKLMDISTYQDKRKIRLKIGEHLKSRRNPLIIIDEAENLKLAAYGSIKALYDDVKDFAGIVLLGANNYLEFLQKKAVTNHTPFPQIYSRFSCSPAVLNTMNKKDVAYICELNELNDPSTINHLFDTCSDYRELDTTIKRILRNKEIKSKSLNVA